MLRAKGKLFFSRTLVEVTGVFCFLRIVEWHPSVQSAVKICFGSMGFIKAYRHRILAI